METKLNVQERYEFIEACNPAVEFLKKLNPHYQITITSESAELFSGEYGIFDY